ncbi:MAG: type II toxin-antitoxin system HicA family toxin [Patescibacteria group bacterium]
MAAFKPREVISILQKLGFIRKRQTGSHVIMYNSNPQRTIPVPMHAKDIKKGLLRSIIKQAESTEQIFLKLK